jgi:hypothetical protein
MWGRRAWTGFGGGRRTSGESGTVLLGWFTVKKTKYFRTYVLVEDAVRVNHVVNTEVIWSNLRGCWICFLHLEVAKSMLAKTWGCNHLNRHVTGPGLIIRKLITPKLIRNNFPSKA